jgi:Fic family protein
MEQLFKWLKNSDEHILLKSCIFHYEFEFIHPFSDGNGRIGRLWQSVILYNYNPLFASLPTESIVRNHQEAYYKALEDSTAIGESTPFIEFMLDMILQTIIRFEDEVGNRVGNKVGNLTQNQIHAKKLDIVNRVGGTRGYWKVKG